MPGGRESRREKAEEERETKKYNVHSLQFYFFLGIHTLLASIGVKVVSHTITQSKSACSFF